MIPELFQGDSCGLYILRIKNTKDFWDNVSLLSVFWFALPLSGTIFITYFPSNIWAQLDPIGCRNIVWDTLKRKWVIDLEWDVSTMFSTDISTVPDWFLYYYSLFPHEMVTFYAFTLGRARFHQRTYMLSTTAGKVLGSTDSVSILPICGRVSCGFTNFWTTIWSIRMLFPLVSI
jgi:hypothetical protein